MKINSIKSSHIIKNKDNLFECILHSLKSNIQTIKENSILVIAETVVATTQGRIINLKNNSQEKIKIPKKANELGKKYNLNPALVNIIMKEADQIIGGLPGLLLTAKNGILIANAGIDKSNSGSEGEYSLWPENPFEVAQELCIELKKEFSIKSFGVIISDSRVQPMRKGVVGVAIGVAGFEPIIDCRGQKDLFGHPLHHTVRALADQIADAAHIVMGEADEQTPFVLVEDAPVNFTDKRIDKNEMNMPMEQDLFFLILKNIKK